MRCVEKINYDDLYCDSMLKLYRLQVLAAGCIYFDFGWNSPNVHNYYYSRPYYHIYYSFQPNHMISIEIA